MKFENLTQKEGAFPPHLSSGKKKYGNMQENEKNPEKT
jgi:hypothetical protein